MAAFEVDSNSAGSVIDPMADQGVISGRRSPREKVKVYAAIALVCSAMAVGLTIGLTRQSSPEASALAGTFACETDLDLSLLEASMGAKGLSIDDESFNCPNSLLATWPGTKTPIKYLRLFRASQTGWKDVEIEAFANSLAAHVKKVDAKVLVGTQITCTEMEDEVDWDRTKVILNKLGPEHVLAVAVGNELDQLAAIPGVSKTCVDKIWSGYLLDSLNSRAKDLQGMAGFESTPVTSVFTAGILWGTGDLPFKETDTCKVNTFMSAAVKAQKNWVFVLNIYPYFDGELKMDDDNLHCKGAIAKSVCLDKADCAVINNVLKARERMKLLTGNDNDPFWIGEMGWSTPIAGTLQKGGGAMTYCPDFSDHWTFKQYYDSFLSWDLSAPNVKGPELAFYFTMRDSLNFGVTEHFGLIDSCQESECKLQQPKVCASGLTMTSSQKMSHKGLVVDSTSISCSDKLLDVWPNTEDTVKIIRIPVLSQRGWEEKKINAYIDDIVEFAQRNGAKVLVTTQISCNGKDDDLDWERALRLIVRLGRLHLLGVAVGELLDLMASWGTSNTCINNVWTSYLFDKLTTRKNDLSNIEDLKGIRVPLTSIFSSQIIWNDDGKPFMETEKAQVNTFVSKVVGSGLKDSWVFAITLRPYFDPNLKMDADGKHCNDAMKKALCFNEESCLIQTSLTRARNSINSVMNGGPLWLAETLWSSPMATTLSSEMKNCEEYSSLRTFETYYKNFLEWDMKIDDYSFGQEVDVEFAFYSGYRDIHTAGSGKPQYSGLMTTCAENSCKLAGDATEPSNLFEKSHADDAQAFTAQVV